MHLVKSKPTTLGDIKLIKYISLLFSGLEWDFSYIKLATTFIKYQRNHQQIKRTSNLHYDFLISWSTNTPGYDFAKHNNIQTTLTKYKKLFFSKI